MRGAVVFLDGLGNHLPGDGVLVDDLLADTTGGDAEVLQPLIFACHSIGDGLDRLIKALPHGGASVPQGLEQTIRGIKAKGSKLFEALRDFL